jgi:hypothetical protein
VTSYAFELPLALAGDPAASARLRKAVVAESLRPRLKLDTTTIDFRSKIVLRQNVKKIPYAPLS